MYDFARVLKGRFTDGDFNLTLLYNSSTYYDDLAWAAGWLYKATKQVGSVRGVRRRLVRTARSGPSLGVLPSAVCRPPSALCLPSARQLCFQPCWLRCRRVPPPILLPQVPCRSRTWGMCTTST